MLKEVGAAVTGRDQPLALARRRLTPLRLRLQLLSMLINAAYKPGRVLKELQEVREQSWECQEETLKAK